MTKTPQTGAATVPGQAAALPAFTSTEAQRLHRTIVDMVHMVSRTLDQIDALAQLALSSMETPAGYQHPERIARTLGVVRELAQNLTLCVESEAETAGLSLEQIDPAYTRRLAARETARTAAKGGEQ